MGSRSWYRNNHANDNEPGIDHRRDKLTRDAKMKNTRRDFLKAGATMAATVSAVGEGLPFAASSRQAVPPTVRNQDMLYRNLGRTGAQVSALGIGGHHLGDIPS